MVQRKLVTIMEKYMKLKNIYKISDVCICYLEPEGQPVCCPSKKHENITNLKYRIGSKVLISKEFS
jgi:uncharacterized membrane protein YcaP (DUF421 family)